MREPLSMYALNEGVTNLRVILNTTAGFWHAGALCPFTLERTQSALQALDELDRQARLWRTARPFRDSHTRRRADVDAIEREVAL